MKSIVCSATSVTVLTTTQTILEVLLGKFRIRDFTITSCGDVIDVIGNGVRKANDPKRQWPFDQPIEFRLEIPRRLVVAEKGHDYDDQRFEIQISLFDPNRTSYRAWKQPNSASVWIFDWSDDEPVWFKGTSHKDRWTEPYNQGSVQGLQFEI